MFVLEHQEVNDEEPIYVPYDPTMGQAGEIVGLVTGGLSNIVTGFVQGEVAKKQAKYQAQSEQAQIAAQKEVSLLKVQTQSKLFLSLVPWVGVFALGALVIYAKTRRAAHA